MGYSRGLEDEVNCDVTKSNKERKSQRVVARLETRSLAHLHTRCGIYGDTFPWSDMLGYPGFVFEWCFPCLETRTVFTIKKKRYFIENAQIQIDQFVPYTS